MTDTKQDELNPCPMCGSRDIGGAVNIVHCYKCGLSISKDRPLQNAVDAWNTRTPTAPVSADMAKVYGAFGIGANARDIGILMENIRNVRRFADYLAAIEREFFMVPGTPSDEPEDAGYEPEDECLLNKWGSTKEEYVEQFRAALSTPQGEDDNANI